MSKRDFDIIKKLMKMDPLIFEIKDFNTNISPYTYTVDLSKYQHKKIPQDCKEILFSPQKMRVIFERYWDIASDIDTRDREAFEERGRKKHQPRLMKKTEMEFKLMDKLLEVLDRVANEDIKNRTKAISKLKGKKSFSTALIKDGFELHADKIMTMIKTKGFCTRS